MLHLLLIITHIENSLGHLYHVPYYMPASLTIWTHNFDWDLFPNLSLYESYKNVRFECESSYEVPITLSGSKLIFYTTTPQTRMKITLQDCDFQTNDLYLSYNSNPIRYLPYIINAESVTFQKINLPCRFCYKILTEKDPVHIDNLVL